MFSDIDTGTSRNFFRKYEREISYSPSEKRVKKNPFTGISNWLYNKVNSFFEWEVYESFPSNEQDRPVKQSDNTENTMEWELNQSALDIALNDASACASVITPPFMKKWIDNFRRFFIIYIETDEMLDEDIPVKEIILKENIFQRSGTDIKRFVMTVNNSVQNTCVDTFNAFTVVWKKLNHGLKRMLRKSARKSYKFIFHSIPTSLGHFIKKENAVLIRGSDPSKNIQSNTMKRRF